jgi:hypothetical protein
LLELLVSVPGTEDLGKFAAILTESLNLIRHVGYFDLNLTPWDVFPFGHGVLNLGVKIVKLVKQLNLFLSSLQVRV